METQATDTDLQNKSKHSKLAASGHSTGVNPSKWKIAIINLLIFYTENVEEGISSSLTYIIVLIEFFENYYKFTNLLLWWDNSN